LLAGYMQCEPQIAYKTKHFRYWLSGTPRRIGWSLAWECFSTRRMGRCASWADSASMLRKSSSLTADEQEHVTRTPAGRSIFMARRLSSLYPRMAAGRCFLDLANAGGAKTRSAYFFSPPAH